MNTSPPNSRTDRTTIVPQTVRWGVTDGLPAGIRLWNEDQTEAEFVTWHDLRPELEKHLLNQLFANGEGYSFATNSHHGKPDWLVQVIAPDESIYCDVWFGNDPENGWAFDGLIRVGKPDPTVVWQTYQRFSDGTYRRRPSRFRSIDPEQVKGL